MVTPLQQHSAESVAAAARCDRRRVMWCDVWRGVTLHGMGMSMI
jgi:hypothetical protein